MKGHDNVTDPRAVFPEAAEETWNPACCLRLGPPIRPEGEIRSGPPVNYAARVWCMIDTLLTRKTISDALTETERRSQ